MANRRLDIFSLFSTSSFPFFSPPPLSFPFFPPPLFLSFPSVIADPIDINESLNPLCSRRSPLRRRLVTTEWNVEGGIYERCWVFLLRASCGMVIDGAGHGRPWDL